MYNKYKVTLSKDVGPWIEFNLNKKPKHLPDHFPSKYNQEMIVSISKQCQVDYYFDLVEQQAKNIYLNMKADGVRFPHGL